MKKLNCCFCIQCGKEADINKMHFTRVPKKNEAGIIIIKMQYEYKCPNCGTESVFNPDIINEIRNYGK